jgi:hypothetical protein
MKGKKIEPLDMDKLTLLNPKNFKPLLKNTSNEICTQYVNLIINYLTLISHRIIMKNHNHLKFIIEKGVETISHIFSLMLFYTKNLELTTYHTEKAFYFYTEFIEQISDDQITFLQLSSKEAVLFAYKKTIYDLHVEYKKQPQPLSPEEKMILSSVDLYKKINKTLIRYIIYNNGFYGIKKKEYINGQCNLLYKVNVKLLNGNFNLILLECIYNFSSRIIDIILTHNDNKYVYYDIVNTFINKLINKKKIKNIHEIINNKIQLNDIAIILNNISNQNVLEISNFVFCENN